MQYLLRRRCNLLQLWKKYEIFAETNRVRAEQLRRHFDPWIRDQEEQQSGGTDVEKGPSEKARKPPNDTCAMVRQRNAQDFVVTHLVERKRHNAIRQNCFGEKFLRRFLSWENWKSAGKLADNFVIVIKLGSNPLEDEQLEFSAFFKPWWLANFFSELGQVSVDWRKTSRQPTEGVNSTGCFGIGSFLNKIGTFGVTVLARGILWKMSWHGHVDFLLLSSRIS